MMNMSQPTPSPSWASRIGRLVAGLFNPTSGEEPTPSSFIGVTTGNETNNILSVANEWRIYNSRKNVWRDINQMDSEDEFVSTALDIIADNSVAYMEDSETTFSIIAENKETQKTLDNLVRRLDLHNELWHLVRNSVKYGNEFREVLLDLKLNQIIGIKPTISYQIYPNTNEKGDKIPGWIYKDDQAIQSNSKGVFLEEWQILPFIYGQKMGILAVPPLASARRNWQRLQRMEDGMAIARLVRAYDKMVHRVPIKSEFTKDDILETINRYKTNITKRKMVGSDGALTQSESPLDVQTDFYLPDDGTNRGGIEMLSSQNTQLGNLNDIYYHRERLIARLKVPVSYLQITSAQKTHLKASNLTGGEELQFARMLRQVQAVIKRGLRRLCDLELTLHGIIPGVGDGVYNIQLTPITVENLAQNASIDLDLSQAATYYTEAFGMLPVDFMVDKFMRLTTEQKDTLKAFFNKNGATIDKAKIGKIKNESEKPKTGVLPGKSTKQSVPFDKVVDAFAALKQSVHEGLAEAGIDSPDIPIETWQRIVSDDLDAALESLGS